MNERPHKTYKMKTVYLILIIFIHRIKNLHYDIKASVLRPFKCRGPLNKFVLPAGDNVRRFAKIIRYK